MLADEMTQLLTAYVDGELSPRERQKALHLLHKSSTARTLLAQLQENAHKVKQLPRRALGAGFAAEVMRTIADRQVRPVRARRPVARLRWVPYAVAGLAASLLFVIAIGSALFVAEESDWFRPGDVNPGNGVANVIPVDPAPANPKVELPRPARKSNPLIARVIEGAMVHYAAPVADRSLSVRFQDLKKVGAATNQLAAELKQGPALQLDVTVRNNPQAIARLKGVLQKHGIKLVVDPDSGVLKNAPGKGAFLVYAENVRVDELTTVFTQLAAEEKKSVSPFDKVTVSSLSAQEHRQVASLLGIDPTKREPGGTQGMIQPGPKPPAGKKVERVAVVLPQTPTAKSSDEVRQFLFQPARPQPGSVRVLLRIHQE